MNCFQCPSIGFCTYTCGISKSSIQLGERVGRLLHRDLKVSIQECEIQCPIFLLVCTAALASSSSGYGRFLGLGCLSSTANATIEAPAAGAWLLLAHAALPVRALTALTQSRQRLYGQCFHDKGFLASNCLCPISGRDTITVACQAHSGHLGNLKSVFCPVLRYTTLAMFLGLLLAICLLPTFSFELSSICRSGLLHLNCQYVIASLHREDK